jgi:hypothetical protein
MNKILILVSILFLSACSPSTPYVPPVSDDLDLSEVTFIKVDYQTAFEQWQTRDLIISESVNVLRTLTTKPLEVSEVDVNLSLWLVLYSADNSYHVARTLDNLYVKDVNADQWYVSENTSFDLIFGWVYPDYRVKLDRFEDLAIKGAVSEEYKSLLLNEDLNNVISTLLNDSAWTPHLERFDETLWYDAIITMVSGDTLFLLEDELGSLLWVVSADEKSHGYVLEGYVISKLISEMTPSFLMQYFNFQLIEAELIPEDYEEDGVRVDLDEIISTELIENSRMDEWVVAVDIPAVGLMVDLILHDEVFSYVFAPWQESDLVMVRNNILQTNDFYLTPVGLGKDLRARIETYLDITPNP